MQFEGVLLLTGLLVVVWHFYVNATDLGALLLARMLGISQVLR